MTITVDGGTYSARLGEPLIDVMNRSGSELAQVCYHPQLGPIGTCDTCMVEVNGELVRSCKTEVSAGQTVKTAVAKADAAQREGYDRLMGWHDFYCTICDNNNHNCTLHNTLGLLKPDHQEHEYRPKGYAKDFSNPFYRYDPDQCILCGRCVQACQNVQVNETLSIDWTSPNPRVLWDGGKPINESSHEGNMTFKSEGITSKVPDAFVEVSPELAAERGLESGSWVRLVSPDGAAKLRVLVTERVFGKEVYVPMNSVKAADAVNRLTGQNRDSVTHTPAYKDTSVRMEILGEVGENPMPTSNPRWYTATPQMGVEVQRKWAQAGYRMPGTGGDD